MQGNDRKTGSYSTGIIQPRFPRLRPKPFLEIVQYHIGREEMTKKVNQLYQKFESYLDVMVPPLIRSTTEPFEVADYYAQTVIDILDCDGFQQNIVDFFTKDKNILIEFRDSPGGFYTMPFGWINFVDSNYKNWMLFIMRRLSEFGIDDQWRYLREVKEFDPDMDEEDLNARKDEFDEEEFLERLLDADQFASDFNIEMKRELKFKKAKRPTSLRKPECPSENLIYLLIQQGIELVDQFKPKQSINQFSNETKAYENCHLTLDQVYFLCEYNNKVSDTVQSFVFERIEDMANQCGIADYCISHPIDKEYDPDAIDVSTILKLNKFAENLNEVAQLIEFENGIILTEDYDKDEEE